MGDDFPLRLIAHPYFLSAVGVVFAISVFLEIIAVSVLSMPVIEGWMIGIVTSVPFISALIYGGYWLTESSISRERYRRINLWGVAGLIISAVLITAINSVIQEMTLVDGVTTIRWAGSIGASIGGVIGGFEAQQDDYQQMAVELERERDRFETVFNAIPVPAIHGEMVDGEPTFLSVNRAFEDIFGYGSEDVKGFGIDDVVVPVGGHDRADDINESLVEGGRIETEVSRNTATGERQFLLTARTMATDPEESGRQEIVVTYVDVTDMHEREQELKRQNERLDQFASVVSHDLRSPLNVAEGRTELAREECDSDHLDAVASAHDRMETLIDDLLRLAREGQPVGEFKTVDLEDLAESSWETVASEGATVNTRTLPTIKADRSRVKQLLENLFQNAVEHGGEEVTVTLGELDAGFYIEDNGPGIGEEDREKVFETGYSTAEGGTGFGLAIVREIVEAHGWSITVTEGTVGGARFEITGVEIQE